MMKIEAGGRKQPDGKQEAAMKSVFAYLATLTDSYGARGGEFIGKDAPAREYYDRMKGIALNFNAAGDGAKVRLCLPNFIFSDKKYPYNEEIFATLFSAILYSAQFNGKGLGREIMVRAAEYDFEQLIGNMKKPHASEELHGCLALYVSPPISPGHSEQIIKAALPFLFMSYPRSESMGVDTALAQSGFWEHDSRRVALAEKYTMLAIPKMVQARGQWHDEYKCTIPIGQIPDWERTEHYE